MLPGHTYIIRNQSVNDRMSIWLEDLITQESAGKVIASGNEPLTSRNRILDHTDYFTFQSPQDEGWIILSRDSEYTTLYRKGPGLDDRYIIKIGVIKIEPTMLENNSSVEDILSNFNNYQLKYFADRKRFKVISHDTNYPSERGEFCLTYHTVIEDKNAQKHSYSVFDDVPMRIEKVGNICRPPQNKKILILYEYQFQYYPGHEDTHLQENASKVFNVLKF